MAGLAALGYVGERDHPAQDRRARLLRRARPVRRAGGLGEHARRARRSRARVLDRRARGGGRGGRRRRAGPPPPARAGRPRPWRRRCSRPGRLRSSWPHGGRRRQGRSPRASTALPRREVGSADGWPPHADGATLLVNTTPLREVARRARRGPTVVDLAYRTDGGAGRRSSPRRGPVVDGLEVLVQQGAASFERWTDLPAPVDVMRAAVRSRVTLTLTTAGESRPGPRRDPDRPSRRARARATRSTPTWRGARRAGESRQRIEQDRVEVLTGLRHGRTLGTPLALVVPNRDHELGVGMSPWPPEGEPAGKGRSRSRSRARATPISRAR